MGTFGIQLADDCLGQPTRARTVGVAAWHVRGGTLELLQPEVFLRLGRFAAGMGLQAFGPVLERRGLGREFVLKVQALQIFQHNPPGHTVYHQVMHNQQQALGTISHLGEDRTQQRAVLQVEAALGALAQCEQLGVALHRFLPQQGCGRRIMSRTPTVRRFTETQAQYVVMLDDRLQCRFQQVPLQRLPWRQQQ